MKTPYQPTGEPVGLIHKYYPSLGEHLPSPTLPELAAKWYSDLSVSGIDRINHYCTIPYEQASNQSEFLACLNILLTEAEKHSHLRGYGYRQHFAATDLTPAIEERLEANGNAAIRAVRDWHTEVSLPPIERFVHRARKIELWRNEQHQLTTLGLDSTDWRDVYNPLFLDLRRAVYHTEPILLRAAYSELSLLLPTLHTYWLPRMDEDTGEESNPTNYFHAGQLVDYWNYCEFVPLRPTSTTTSQRDPCFFVWLSCHLDIKQWYVWEAVKLLAQTLDKPAPETPLAFLPPVPKPEPLALNPYSYGIELPQWPDAPAAPEPPQPSNPTLDTPAPTMAAYPWAEIEALAVRIELRKAGRFTPANKLVASAVAGLIDALREAKMLPAATTLPTLYAAFRHHYKCRVGTDRITTTRTNWQDTARKALGLD